MFTVSYAAPKHTATDALPPRASRACITRVSPDSADDPVAFGRLFDDTTRAASRGEAVDDQAELRTATMTFVRRMKWMGSPPERVLVVIKRAIADAAAGAGEQLPSLSDEELDNRVGRRAIGYRHVFCWFLEAYYPLQ